jgi:PAS domain-containing protein
LRNWSGYSQIRYFDRDSRPANAADLEVRSVEMIPLALYGLDHPKIPALLVDFRDSLNPKGRELSRRALHDLTKNIFSLSSFGNIPYFLGHRAYEWMTGRRGMDLNQPTRLNSYSELKLLLSFNASIEPKLRNEIERRLDNVSVNPLNNDSESEVALARQQYDSLLEFVRRPDGLSARIERDRRAEMVPLEHGRTARFFYNLGNVLTFGRYLHRETATPELTARMELARRLEGHTQFLRAVAKSSPQTEVVWDLEPVKTSLQFLAERGAGANGSAARAASAIFQRTSDAEVRRLCLDALHKINSKTARNELLRVYREEQTQSEWRAEIADRLRKAVAEDTRMKPAEVRSVLGQVGQP